MGENEIAERVVEHEEGMYGGHPFTQARVAIVEAIAILTHREELAEIVGPVGPQLSTSKLHPAIWNRAAKLWDDGHFPEAVRSAASALEGLLQAIAGLGVSGTDLVTLYGLNDPTPGSPRLRLRGIDPDPTSKPPPAGIVGDSGSQSTSALGEDVPAAPEAAVPASSTGAAGLADGKAAVAA